MVTLDCYECHVAREFAKLHACPRHATIKQRRAAEERVLEVAANTHPLLQRHRGGR